MPSLHQRARAQSMQPHEEVVLELPLSCRIRLPQSCSICLWSCTWLLLAPMCWQLVAWRQGSASVQLFAPCLCAISSVLGAVSCFQQINAIYVLTSCNCCRHLREYLLIKMSALQMPTMPRQTGIFMLSSHCVHQMRWIQVQP